MNDQNNTRALTRQNGNAQLSQPQGAPPTALDYSQIDPAIMARAAAIAADVQANDGTVTPAQALAAAYHFASTGEVYGRHSYVGGKGQVSGRVLEGYRNVSRQLDMSRYQVQYRDMTAEERQQHDIKPGDTVLVCELTTIKARTECVRAGLPYYPTIGITVIRKGQFQSIPKNRTLRWVLEKQCRVDALRQMGENVAADEVLAEAGIEAPEGYLSVEQAERYVASKQETQAAMERHNAMTPEEKQADIDALKALNALRKLDEQHAFDGGPCPLCGAPEKAGHTAECGLRVLYPNAKTWVAPSDAGASAEESEALFEQMPSAQQERAEVEQPKGAPLCGLCGNAMWDNREKKAAGSMKANAPDFACKNKECGGRVWKFKRLHWCDNPTVMSRLRAYANQHNVLDFAGILSLLNVQDLHDFDGTMYEAKTAIDQWAAAQQPA